MSLELPAAILPPHEEGLLGNKGLTPRGKHCLGLERES